MQALTDLATTASKEVFAKSITLSKAHAEVVAGLGEVAISNGKVLQEKLAQTFNAGLETTWSAAQAAAGAKTLAEIGKAQADYFTSMASLAIAQQKEMTDISVRATHALIEQAQAAASKLSK